MPAPKYGTAVDLNQFVINSSDGAIPASSSIDVVTGEMRETSRAKLHTKQLHSLAIRGAKVQLQVTVGMDDGTA